MLWNKKLILFYSLIVVCFLSACTEKEKLADGSELIHKNQFVFAASGEFKPFSYINDDLTMSGFDIEVGEALAKEMGLEPVQKRIKFKGIVEGVKTGRADAAVASHTINPQRSKYVSFSTPYYYSGPQIFTRPDSKIKTVKDLEGKEVAVAKGSTYADTASKYTDKVKTYDSDITALQALSSGRHDAVITDFVTGKSAAKEGFKIKAQELISRSEQAIVLPQDNPKLLKKINEALDELRKDGTLTKISLKYFGEDITKKPE
ncbi:transporter substrate-binding domain-containing protein [Niallia taxi]|uniref:Transporter substrate-binding domain-containing protein n=1 Tax=Niallia taxi TaxID=2499688 RepID=A0A437K816_9BACI|nr:transporter substrate-binding domain-containing protein [Niallia taxi]MDK8643479.1 transporter substrate-binding domain-containing protein [Niallia taxi]MED3962814.1 transporter substrate-binding domain-containing protein [Niallia taxi]RVT59984.1 transporter substrate-binding domain-containing protein [Niallia taxi]WOD65686.1 transporter substrate-binding domain-containing protein [Niallia taxi]